MLDFPADKVVLVVFASSLFLSAVVFFLISFVELEKEKSAHEKNSAEPDQSTPEANRPLLSKIYALGPDVLGFLAVIFCAAEMVIWGGAAEARYVFGLGAWGFFLWVLASGWKRKTEQVLEKYAVEKREKKSAEEREALKADITKALIAELQHLKNDLPGVVAEATGKKLEPLLKKVRA